MSKKPFIIQDRTNNTSQYPLFIKFVYSVRVKIETDTNRENNINITLIIVTCSDILSLVEARRSQLEKWSESGVIKFQRHVIQFPRTSSSIWKYEMIFVIAPLFFFIYHNSYC